MEKVYIQIARDLGCIEDEQKRQKFYVGSGLNPTELKRHEYTVWQSVRTMNNIPTWKFAISKKVRFMTNDSIDSIEARLLELKTIHPFQFSSIEEPMLKELYVIRNGYAWGQKGNFWIMSTQDHSRKFNLSSIEEYDLWIEASSYRNLHTLTTALAKKRNIHLDDALKIVVKAARNFVRAGVWTIEYIEGGAI